MFESPLKQDGSIDKNGLDSLIESLQQRLDSIDRQKESAPEASLGSLEAQKQAIEKQIRDLRSGLSSDIEMAA